MLNRLRKVPSLRKFLSDVRGSIKIMFTITAPFVMLLAGAGVDTAEVYRARINFQNAVDAGALMAAKTLAATGNTNKASEAGEELFFGNIRNIAEDVADANITFDFGNGDCVGNPIVANATLKKRVYFSFLRAKFFANPKPQEGYLVDNSKEATEDEKKVTMYGLTEVKCGSDTLELALVLDNSGSMGYNGKIATLRSAASNLVNTLFTNLGKATRPEAVKFSVVPFSSMVNVGPSNRNASWMDTNGISSVHAQHLNWDEDPLITKVGNSYRDASGQTLSRFTLYDSMNIDWAGCVEMRPYPHHTQDTTPTSAEPDSMFVPSFAPDTPDNWTYDDNGNRQKDKILVTGGSKEVCTQFQSATYYRRGRLRTRSIRRCDVWSDDYRGQTHPQDTGYRPHWDDRIEYERGVYTGSNGITTAVWVDNNNITEETYQNNYLKDDHNYPAALALTNHPMSRDNTGTGEEQHKRQRWHWKYMNNPNPRDINNDRNGLPNVLGAEGGPNAWCESEPITDLTANNGAVQSAIAGMKAVGSTNISQGVAWGWRTLSPDQPFTRGRPYSTADNKKVMIVMTDGNNTYYPINYFYNGYSNRNKSYYSAYDMSETNRIFDGFDDISNPNHDFNTFSQAMDSHLVKTCTNVKATGIQVYTIAFDVPNGSSVKQMLEQCASNDVGGGKLYYDAKNNAELIATFQRISEKLSELAITK